MADERSPPVAATELTFLAPARRGIRAARRELRSPPRPVWEPADPRAVNERFAGHHGGDRRGGVDPVVARRELPGCECVGAGRGQRRCRPRSASNRRHGPADTWIVEFGDPEAITQFAAELDRVDVLVNNVGFNDDARGPQAPAPSWRHVLGPPT